MTTTTTILKYLKSKKKFVFGGELERIISLMTQSKPSAVARRLRELAEEGLIYKDYEKVGIKRKVRVVKYRV